MNPVRAEEPLLFVFLSKALFVSFRYDLNVANSGCSWGPGAHKDSWVAVGFLLILLSL